MFHLGGEYHEQEQHWASRVTMCGRCSLRLALKNASLAGKRVLLPDFLCKVIPQVLRDCQVDWDFYQVKPGFEFSLPSNLARYAALYLIRYFGNESDSFKQAVRDFPHSIIVDDVFSPFPRVLKRAGDWYSFNSLRKISSVGISLLRSSRELPDELEPAPVTFFQLKDMGRREKARQLRTGLEDERAYLTPMEEAEGWLDRQGAAFLPDQRSLPAAFKFYASLEDERRIRQANYKVVKEMAGGLLIPVESNFFSFAPLMISRRDEVRVELMKRNVFLPVHWPGDETNAFSDSIISIPLDARYKPHHMRSVMGWLLELVAG